MLSLHPNAIKMACKSQTTSSDVFSKCTLAYFTKDVLSSPIKASAAPLTAVFLQPKWSVNMLTTGEQKKIMPMARAPTQAAEEEKKRHDL